LPEALAALLVQRGHHEAEAARHYLRPALGALTDPATLAGMAEAVDAIVTTVRAGGTIMVHGDYDVDGQCATALLTRALRAGSADVVPFVPHRMRDGYDFGTAGVAAAAVAGVSLIVTCDCGITAVDAVAAARGQGMEVVVTDHHLPGPALPDATAVVDPQRADDTSGLSQLCGTGIAFKLVEALIPALNLPASLHLHLLDLVALATVADVVPLTGENRILVKHGLKVLARSRWPGIRALVKSSGLAGKEIRAGHLGYILGPRLNAAGRIGEAMDGVRLLLSDNDAEADAIAASLGVLNDRRQTMDQRILDEAVEQVEREMDPDRDAAFVLSGEDWHAGVVGIVASRIVERYGRPTFLVAFDGDVGKGSGRSISAFDLHSALHECGALLERYGGHRMAAGLTIRRENLAAFRERFAAVARERLRPEDLGPEQRIDLVIALEEATEELERLSRHLEPCGTGNPAPVFGVRGAQLASARRVGSGHLKATLLEGFTRIPAIGFNWADRVTWLPTDPVDAAFRLEMNEWNGNSSLQARLLALAPAGAG
ncbi:MAG TPA: single-stranded-DNA-specific exonuclease RecJ, partial [Gemmatimonadales bacterium]|nr:single-stranded-DNA-specific exonuclease RecJ [Gemmatimonadales bacterium]